MLFSTATGYALRALAALPEDGTYSLAKDLASHLELPGPYLAKILQSLAQEGILHSVRGPRGGFRLARPARGITLSQVMAAAREERAREVCLLGASDCSPEQPCLLHLALGEPWQQFAAALARVTLADLQVHARPSGAKPLSTRNLRTRIA